MPVQRTHWMPCVQSPHAHICSVVASWAVGTNKCSLHKSDCGFGLACGGLVLLNRMHKHSQHSQTLLLRAYARNICMRTRYLWWCSLHNQSVAIVHGMCAHHLFVERARIVAVLLLRRRMGRTLRSWQDKYSAHSQRNASVFESRANMSIKTFMTHFE